MPTTVKLTGSGFAPNNPLGFTIQKNANIGTGTSAECISKKLGGEFRPLQEFNKWKIKNPYQD